MEGKFRPSCCVFLSSVSPLCWHYNHPYTEHFWQFWSPTCGDFPHNKQVHTTPAGCPAMQLSSDPVFTEITWRPHKTSPPAHFICQSRVQVIHLCFLLTGYVSVSKNSLFQFNELAGAPHRTQENTSVYQFIRGYDKGYRWIATWKDNMGEFWDGPKCRTYPCGVGVCHPPSVELSEPASVGILWRLPQVGLINYYLLF